MQSRVMSVHNSKCVHFTFRCAEITIKINLMITSNQSKMAAVLRGAHLRGGVAAGVAIGLGADLLGAVATLGLQNRMDE